MLGHMRRLGASMRRSLLGTAWAMSACVILALCAAGAFAEPLDQPWDKTADFSAREVTAMLFKAKAGDRPDLSSRDLMYLDLAGLDFKGAILARSNLYGADLTSAALKGADLSYARLDRAVIIKADLSGANLRGATILRPTVFADATMNLADAPRFAGANLSGVRLQADLSGADFRGADLTGARFDPLEARPGSGTLATAYRNVFKSCDFSGARAQGADFTQSILMFSRFTGADLRGAKFIRADLSMVDLSGADVTDADFSRADLDGVILAGVKGLETVKGLDTAVNLDRARH